MTLQIDSEYLDLDFPSCPEFTFGDNGVRSLDSFGFRSYEDTVETIPRNQWEGIAEEIAESGGGLERLVVHVFNQGNEGSCVGNATAQGHMLAQAKQFGEENVVILSPISLYKRIGRSPNSGSTLDDAWEELNSRGILPLDTSANRAVFGDQVMPATGFYTRFPGNWTDTARKFAGAEGHIIRSVEGMATALLRQEPVIVGRQGHSICYVALVFKNGRMFALYVNSWGQWGQAAGDMDYGFGWDSESTLRQSAAWAFVIRQTVVPEEFFKARRVDGKPLSTSA